MRLLIVTLGLLTATAAHSQSTYYYDGQGRPAGRVERFGNQQQFYGSDGSYQGSSQRFGNQQQFYGPDGSPQGSSQHFGRW